ncbi:hypothetical protein [Tenacibaculum ovolyticum]|uniref:hypothetical protein n=1 Tax=Tenacibaculum ovolyticum TaxID=104270 RepID=UPI003BA919F0
MKTLKNRILPLIIIVLVFNSCGIFKTHHKDKLIDFENNQIPKNSLKLNGYYFAELESENKKFNKVYGKKIKYLSVIFIYEDGFIITKSFNGLSNYYCAKNKAHQNTYESAHKALKLMLESKNSKERKIKRICSFKPKDIMNKGLAKIQSDNLKIQFYQIESQNPKMDSNNSAYLYELNGIIKSDSSFVIKSKTRFRNGTKKTKNILYKFRQTDNIPNIENYFKKNKKRFK